MIGCCTILIFFTLPETEYRRSAASQNEQKTGEECAAGSKDEAGAEVAYSELASVPRPERRTWVQELRIFTGSYTDESLLKLFIRPIVLLTLPPVAWATLVMSVTIGFLVAITSNFATAFSTVYGFETYQTGLCFIASLISSLIGVFFGGHLSDMIADYFTKRNNGIREPEMRLPAMVVSMITSPLALILYGVGIGKELHWIVPTIGLGLCKSRGRLREDMREANPRCTVNFSIVQATNISLVYTIDAYRPVAGEITVSQFAFKCEFRLSSPQVPDHIVLTRLRPTAAFGFLLSFYTNPWIAQAGYVKAFGAMAGISGGIIALWLVFYFFGNKIRHVSWEWGFIKKLAHWNEDREVGE